MSSELRQDLVSGDWIIVSTNRKDRPHQFAKIFKKRKISSVAGCPFEDPQKNGNPEPVFVYPKRAGKNNWRIQILGNKYPALLHPVNTCAPVFKNGPYATTEALGYQDLVITRDHHKNFSDLPSVEAAQVIKGFQERYNMILKDNCVSYVSIFQNWGPTAGASVFHPHYQLIAIPVVPLHIKISINGSDKFYREHKKCVYCVMIEHEIKNKNRVIYENEEAVVFTPFFSESPFEVRVLPKKHFSYFEDTPEETLKGTAAALQYALKKITKNLNDPDYNFFIHTAPIKDKKKHSHYHWHIEIRPKFFNTAGFELGTNLEINEVDPDKAAKILRK